MTMAIQHRIVGPRFAGYTDNDLTALRATSVELLDDEAAVGEYRDILTDSITAIDAELAERSAA